ncbi:MAG: hypothetical protein ACRESE_06965 [Gammaproteobacteria bacterium]
MPFKKSIYHVRYGRVDRACVARDELFTGVNIERLVQQEAPDAFAVFSSQPVEWRLVSTPSAPRRIPCEFASLMVVRGGIGQLRLGLGAVRQVLRETKFVNHGSFFGAPASNHLGVQLVGNESRQTGVAGGAIGKIGQFGLDQQAQVGWLPAYTPGWL